MMAASQSLRLETAQAEAHHAEVKRKVEELKRQYDAHEWAALADFNEKLRATDATFERQIANVAAQLQPSLCESIEGALREKKDMEIDLLQRAYQEQTNARSKDYDAQKCIYDDELFKAITALITAGVSTLARH